MDMGLPSEGLPAADGNTAPPLLTMPNPWQRRAESWGRGAGHVYRILRQRSSGKSWPAIAQAWLAEIKTTRGKKRNLTPLLITMLSLTAMAGLLSARMQCRKY